MNISFASREDLAEISAIHVQCWRETYVGMVPQSYLDGLDAGQRLEKWCESFESVGQGARGLFIARLDGQAVGFVSVGPARDSKYEEYGEVYAIYVLKSFWGQGIGYNLFKAVEDWLKSKGFPQIYLWVLDANHLAMESYAKWGGRIDKDIIKHHEVGGHLIREVQVVFNIE